MTARVTLTKMAIGTRRQAEGDTSCNGSTAQVTPAAARGGRGSRGFWHGSPLLPARLPPGWSSLPPFFGDDSLTARRSISSYLPYFTLITVVIAALVVLVLRPFGARPTAPRPDSRNSTIETTPRKVPETVGSEEVRPKGVPNTDRGESDGPEEPDAARVEEIDAEIERLTSLLSEPDWSKARMAIDSLSSLARESPYAREQLLKRLEEMFGEGRLPGASELAIVLARLNDARVTEALVGIVQSLDGLAEWESAYSGWAPLMVMTRQMSGYDEVIAKLRDQSVDLKSIARLHIIGTLLRGLGQDRSERRDVPFDAGGSFGYGGLVRYYPIEEESVRWALLDIAGGPHASWNRVGAIDALRMSQDAYPRVADEIAQLLRDDDLMVRRSATQALAYRHDPHAEVLLRSALLGEAGKYRETAFETFAQFYYKSGLEKKPTEVGAWVPVLIEGILTEPDIGRRVQLMDAIPGAMRQDVLLPVEPTQDHPKILAALKRLLGK